MGKSRSKPPAETVLNVPRHPALLDYPTDARPVDSHLHLASTFAKYRETYPDGACLTLGDFASRYYAPAGVETLVDVWCEPSAPWREVADDAAASERAGPSGSWSGVKYRFVRGVHPHNAEQWTDAVEADVLAGLAHPSNVGLGEAGLDFHYDHSPRAKQREVLIKQLRIAVRLGKPICIHTREADDDIFEILTTELPRDTRVHVHCFTDDIELCRKLTAHFPNLVIGITGVTTFATNHDTPAAIRHLASLAATDTAPASSDRPHRFRWILETDSPYMAPANLPRSEMGLKGSQRVPHSTSAMLPWTAAFVAQEASKIDGIDLSIEDVFRASRHNASFIYGV